MSEIPEPTEEQRKHAHITAERINADPHALAEMVEFKLFTDFFCQEADSLYSGEEARRYKELLEESRNSLSTIWDIAAAEQTATKVLDKVGVTFDSLTDKQRASIIGNIAGPVMFARLQAVIDFERTKRQGE